MRDTLIQWELDLFNKRNGLMWLSKNNQAAWKMDLSKKNSEATNIPGHELRS